MQKFKKIYICVSRNFPDGVDFFPFYCFFCVRPGFRIKRKYAFCPKNIGIIT